MLEDAEASASRSFRRPIVGFVAAHAYGNATAGIRRRVDEVAGEPLGALARDTVTSMLARLPEVAMSLTCKDDKTATIALAQSRYLATKEDPDVGLRPGSYRSVLRTRVRSTSGSIHARRCRRARRR